MWASKYVDISEKTNKQTNGDQWENEELTQQHFKNSYNPHATPWKTSLTRIKIK